MDADGFDLSFPMQFLSEMTSSDLGNRIIQWSCLFNSHVCTMVTKFQRSEDKETMLCLSIRPKSSKPGKNLNCSKTLNITISNVQRSDQLQCQVGPDTRIQNSCIKKKRGRPRKSEALKEKSKDFFPETDGKRYSLRGVKIAESIMNAEKGVECDTNSSLGAIDSSLFSAADADINHVECENHLKVSLEKKNGEEGSQSENGKSDLTLQEFSDDNINDCPNAFDVRTLSDKIERKEGNDNLDQSDEEAEDFLDSSNNANYCKKCGKTYKNFQTLKNHIKYVHKTYGQQNHCKLCPAKFKHLSVLKQHIDEIHHKKISFTCEVCKKEFARKNQYNRHKLCHRVDESRHLKCPHCDKGFSFKYNLTRHIELVHKPSTENFHCSYCGKGFNLKAAMVSHVQQVHFNIYPFQCSVENCKMGFSRQKQLLEHMQQSHSDMEFQPAQYTRGRYKYGRTEEDLFFCSHCRISFCYKAKLVEHMHFAHNDAFPYVCNECSQGFVEKSYLLHHLKYAHNHSIDNKSIEEAIVEDEDLTEGKVTNYKIIMVDEAGEVLQICQPINKETSAALEVPGKLTDTEETVTLSYSMTSENQEGTTQLIIQPGSDTTGITPQEIANLLLSGGQTVITQENDEDCSIGSSDVVNDAGQEEAMHECGNLVVHLDQVSSECQSCSNSINEKQDKPDINPEMEQDTEFNSVETNNIETRQFSGLNTYSCI